MSIERGSASTICRRWAFAVLTVVFIGSASTTLALQNGTEDHSFSGSGILIWVDSGGLQEARCGLTMIAPQAAITAGHCLIGSLGTGHWEAFFPALGTISVVSHVTPTIARTTTNKPYTNDIGLVVLGPEAQLLPHYPIAALSVGTAHDVTIVGYGNANEGYPHSGKIQTKPACRIAADASNMCITPHNTSVAFSCPGDSGGPVFVVDKTSGKISIVAVVSSGDRNDCTWTNVREGWLSRLSAHRSWINQKLPASSVTSPRKTVVDITANIRHIGSRMYLLPRTHGDVFVAVIGEKGTSTIEISGSSEYSKKKGRFGSIKLISTTPGFMVSAKDAAGRDKTYRVAVSEVR